LVMSESRSFQFSFRVGDGWSGHPGGRRFISGRQHDFCCDPRHWARLFAGKVTPRLVDLLRIGTAVYVADRISQRDRRHADHGGARKLSLGIEVFEHGFWSRAEVSDCLHSCLEFLTGDMWDIRFEKACDAYSPDLLPFDPCRRPYSGPVVVCLYSGGLDSAAGLIKRIRENADDAKIVPVLVRHQSGQGPLVRRQIGLVNSVLGSNLEPLVLPFWMRRPAHYGAEENSQRSRSFLFCCGAAVAAVMTEAQRIEMFECGIGAINVPLMTGMVGWKTTKSSHPTFVRRFSRLLRFVTERDTNMSLPYQYMTKGELVTSLCGTSLSSLLPETASCVHYPLRAERAKECGVCPACIFRRQAVFASGIDEPGSRYKYDLFGKASSRIPHEKLKYVKAFLIQVDKLSQLDYSDVLPDFVVQHLRATEVITDNRIPTELIDLYRRYRREWLDLLVYGSRQGWEWCRMMAPAIAG